MVEIRTTRNLFLRCMNIIYLFAFSSLYIQIPGLFGNNGILPAHTQLETKANNLVENIHNKPTLLWLASYIGLDTEYMMDVLALTGIFLSFTGFLSQKFCNKPMFAALWSLYYSLFQVGQTFMWFQWDILLLEAGFLCIIVSPIYYKTGTRRKPVPQGPAEPLTFFLVRWLLLRLMFSSGIVKLTSGCPHWWGLTALNIHFESMCLPTPLAWFCHHLPTWFLKLTTVFANVCEIFIPPLFLVPVQSVKTVAFWIQAFLQGCIIVSGNFNFFNFLTLVLCLSLLDDSFFNKKQNKTGRFVKLLSYILCGALYGTIIYATYILYSLKLQPNGTIDSKIAFSTNEFNTALEKAFPALLIVGFLSLVATAANSLLKTVTQTSSFFAKIFSIITTIFYILAATLIFSTSLVPFSSLHASGNATLLPESREWHSKLSHLHIINSYGLFRRMTGEGGRPEIIIEGSDNRNGSWLEYNFLYKPGDVNRSPPYVAPHQPRLDWQMWFAALGTYHQNTWLMSLIYRILTNQQEVLALMDQPHNPFKNQPPKFVRATLYYYHYTSWDNRHNPAWWTRERIGEYSPIFSLNDKALLERLKKTNVLSSKTQRSSVNPQAKRVLDELRSVFSRVDGEVLVWSLFFTGLTIILLSKLWTSIPTVTQTSRSKKFN